MSALASSTTSSSPMANFLPDAVFDKVTDITADWLLGRKDLRIALDVDNTIAKYSESLPALRNRQLDRDAEEHRYPDSHRIKQQEGKEGAR